jgi:hypothetical protein
MALRGWNHGWSVEMPISCDVGIRNYLTLVRKWMARQVIDNPALGGMANVDSGL